MHFQKLKGEMMLIDTKLNLTYCIIITCFLMLCVAICPKAQVFVLNAEVNKEAQVFLPASKAVCFEDVKGTLTFDEVQHKEFTPNKSTSLNFGYTKSTYWIRLQIRNQTPYNDWRLLSSIAYHNYLDFWIKDAQGNLKYVETGWLHPFASRGNYEHNGFVFPLNLPQNQVSTVYFRLKGYDPLTFPLKLLRKDTLAHSFQKENLYYGVYFGILAVMILYNLFIFVTLRDKNYIYYVLYILCMFIIFSGSTGYLFRYIHPNSPHINLYSVRLTMGLIVITTSLFTIHFLELKKYGSLMYRLFQVNMGLALLAMLLTGTELYSAATNDLISLHSPLLLIAGVIAWREGNQSARFYVFAWLIFLLGATFITLRNAGILPVNALTTHAVEVGSAIEIILLSLALADRYRILRIEKETATKQALVIQQKANEELEGKVQQRTSEIVDKNEKLSQQKEEITQHTEELKAVNDQLNELHKFKTSMTNMIIHDLKNPLASIMGMASGVDEGRLDKVKIASTARQMLDMVQNILDVQKSEEARIEFMITSVPMAEVIKEVITQQRILANAKNINLRYDIFADDVVRADQGILNRVLSNLISNAIKFTPANGEIRVRSSYINNNTMLKIEIHDTGTGIPHNQLDKVFDKFYSIDKGHLGHVRSTGLGLTFCKLVIEKQGGDIGVTSAENKGSIFWFTLPLAVLSNIRSDDKATSNELVNVILKETIRVKIALQGRDLELAKAIVRQIRKKEVNHTYPIRLMRILEKVRTKMEVSTAINDWMHMLEKDATNQVIFEALLNLENETNVI